LEGTLETAILLLGIGLFVAAAYGDLKTLRIPNVLVAAVTALGLVRLIVIGDLSFALYTVGASLLVFIVTFLLFWRGLVGGGDAKLMTATALLVGYHDLFHFFVLMSICGLLVTLAMLATRRRPLNILGALVSVGTLVTHGPSVPQPKLPKLQLAVPYGVAIAGGGIVTLLFQSSLLG
jgi:prepilin peptidase CpaA